MNTKFYCFYCGKEIKEIGLGFYRCEEHGTFVPHLQECGNQSLTIIQGTEPVKEPS